MWCALRLFSIPWRRSLSAPLPPPPPLHLLYTSVSCFKSIRPRTIIGFHFMPSDWYCEWQRMCLPPCRIRKKNQQNKTKNRIRFTNLSLKCIVVILWIAINKKAATLNGKNRRQNHGMRQLEQCYVPRIQNVHLIQTGKRNREIYRKHRPHCI